MLWKPPDLVEVILICHQMGQILLSTLSALTYIFFGRTPNIFKTSSTTFVQSHININSLKFIERKGLIPPILSKSSGGFFISEKTGTIRQNIFSGTINHLKAGSKCGISGKIPLQLLTGPGTLKQITGDTTPIIHINASSADTEKMNVVKE